MSKRKLLFITEGEVDETKFIDKVFKKCYPSIEYDYYVYSTNLHTLAQLIFKENNEIDEYLDIKNVLRENENIEYKREKLSAQYSDIILVFDFDPHVDNPQFEKIEKMLRHFNDSTNNGKLYINYPMMQSYRHIKSYPEEDFEFKDRVIETSKCSKYKEIVNTEGVFNNINKYEYPKIMKIIGYQLKKANFILNGNYRIPKYNEFFDIDLNCIYKIQCRNNSKNKCVYVLNTFVFNIIEYNPKKVLDKVEEFE